MAGLEPYYFEPNIFKLQDDSIQDSEEDNRLEKKTILLTLWQMPSQLQVLLLLTNFELDGMKSQKHGLAAK